MITLACGACQMQRLGADFFYILLWLVPGFLCYLAATGLEGKSSKTSLSVNAVVFLMVFVFLFGVMPMILVLMLPIVAILLLLKLASKSPRARVAALLGLAPLAAIMIGAKLQRRASGVYYPIDRVTLSETIASHEVRAEKDPFGLTQAQLLEALQSGTSTRQNNARNILLAQVKNSSEAAAFSATAAQLQEMTRSGKLSEDFAREYQEALGAVAQRQTEAEAKPSPTPSSPKKRPARR